MKRSDLGDVVDVRPRGQHADAWKKYLDQPFSPHTKMTIGDYIRGTGVELRGEHFERFLQSIGKQNADVVIGPIGTPETSGGAASQRGTQMVIRSQRVADRLNQMIGEFPPRPDLPTNRIRESPAAHPHSASMATQKRSVGFTRENESAQILAQNGYRVDQNPRDHHAISNPDYEIEGRPFDSYAPGANKSARGIWSYLKEDKVDKLQTSRVVLNLRAGTATSMN